MQSGPSWEATIGEPASSAAHVRGRDRLPRLRAQRLQVGGEDGRGAEHRLDRHGRGDVSGAQQQVEIVTGQQQLAEHAVGAVDQRQPLLLGQRDRLQPHGLEHLGGRTGAAIGADREPFADQRQGDVRERCEITRAAQRSVLVNHRGHAPIEEPGQRQRGRRPDARPSGGQGRQPQRHHRPHDLAFDRRAGPGRVRADQRLLQHRALRGRDRAGRERAEAGRDAVVRFGVRRQRLDDRAAGRDRIKRRRREGHARLAPGHRHQLVLADGTDSDHDRLHSPTVVAGPAGAGSPPFDQLSRRFGDH